jgi:hypothetical protein
VTQPISEAERRRLLCEAARDLLALIDRCPELFLHVIPIDVQDMQTLHELAHDDDDNEEPPDAAG